MAPNFEENSKSVHDERKPFKCVCDAHFANMADLKKHARSVHVERKPFKCEICDAYFTNMADLKKHAKSVHEAKKKFKCPMCVSTLTQKGSLNRHIATVHGGKKQQSEAAPKNTHKSFNDKVVQDLLAQQVLHPSGEVSPKYKRKMKDFNISDSVAQVNKRPKCKDTTLIQEEKEIVKNESIGQESFLGYFNLARKGTEHQIVGKKTRKSFRHRTVSQKIIANRGWA